METRPKAGAKKEIINEALRNIRKSRHDFAKFVEELKASNPHVRRSEIIQMAMGIFVVDKKDVWKFFRKCVYCDSWEVNQRTGYCYNCNAYSGWYEDNEDRPKKYS